MKTNITEIKSKWLEKWCGKIKSFKGIRFNADDLHKIIPRPKHVNHYGVLVAKLSNAGVIVEVGRVTSTRKSRNGAKISVWKVV